MRNREPLSVGKALLNQGTLTNSACIFHTGRDTAAGFRPLQQALAQLLQEPGAHG